MVYKDNIYGEFELPSYVVSIIETPLFQRLKGILQLGVMKYVYPDVSNTRFEHCIGTYKRATEMLNSLEPTLPGKEKKLPKEYRMAVEIAALLHDIGHGPFSHTWEHVCNKSFRHEENGIDCIDAMIPETPEFQPLHESNKYGIELIKALIVGDKTRLSIQLPNEWNFIFDIVNNKRCGLDVDKWDYLKRDAYYLKSLCQADDDFDDIFLKARIAPNGECIEYRYEDYDKIYKLYSVRWQFYLNGYRLPKVCALEHILIDMVNRTPAKLKGLPLCNIKAKDNLHTFTELNDQKVLSLIKDDERYKYLNNLASIVPIDEATATAIAQNSSHEIITIKDSIPGPGIMMPSDNNFEFYGNECDKPSIIRNNNNTNILRYFQLK